MQKKKPKDAKLTVDKSENEFVSQRINENEPFVHLTPVNHGNTNFVEEH